MKMATAAAALSYRISFSLGEEFESYEELEKKLNEYKAENYVEFWKRDARTVECAKRRLNKPLKQELRYYEIKFCCIHGGQTFKTKGKGVRVTS